MQSKTNDEHDVGVERLLAAVFSTVNGVLVHELINLSAVELLSASVGMALWLVLRGQWGPGVWTMSTLDWVWIVVLAVVATSFAFMVSIQVLKKLSPFESAMAINLEPIYAIVLAYVLFDERFSPGFYAGAALVICAVFVDTLLRSRGRGRAPTTRSSDPATFGDAVTAIGGFDQVS